MGGVGGKICRVLCFENKCVIVALVWIRLKLAITFAFLSTNCNYILSCICNYFDVYFLSFAFDSLSLFAVIHGFDFKLQSQLFKIFSDPPFLQEQRQNAKSEPMKGTKITHKPFTLRSP